MYQFTREELEKYWLSSNMKAWIGWWVIPMFPRVIEVSMVKWCNDCIGPITQNWACYDGRFFFHRQTDALIFLLKFGSSDYS